MSSTVTLKWAFRTNIPRRGAPTLESLPSLTIQLRLALQQGWTPPRDIGRVGALWSYNVEDPLGSKVQLAGYGWQVKGAAEHGIPDHVHNYPPLATLEAAREEAAKYLNRCLLYPAEPPAPAQPG